MGTHTDAPSCCGLGGTRPQSQPLKTWTGTAAVLLAILPDFRPEREASAATFRDEIQAAHMCRRDLLFLEEPCTLGHTATSSSWGPDSGTRDTDTPLRLHWVLSSSWVHHTDRTRSPIPVTGGTNAGMGCWVGQTQVPLPSCLQRTPKPYKTWVQPREKREGHREQGTVVHCPQNDSETNLSARQKYQVLTAATPPGRDPEPPRRRYANVPSNHVLEFQNAPGSGAQSGTVGSK